jgi:hypothetical protein
VRHALGARVKSKRIGPGRQSEPLRLGTVTADCQIKDWSRPGKGSVGAEIGVCCGPLVASRGRYDAPASGMRDVDLSTYPASPRPPGLPRLPTLYIGTIPGGRKARRRRHTSGGCGPVSPQLVTRSRFHRLRSLTRVSVMSQAPYVTHVSPRTHATLTRVRLRSR